MFADASVVGCWDVLAARLDAGVLAGWAAREPDLAGLGCVPDLLAAWDDPLRTHRVGDALVRLAAADGGADDDALLTVLHLASPVVWRIVGQLGDLGPDVVGIAVSELCCHVRCYPWRTRRGGLLTNLEAEVRAGVLAELRPTSRRHRDRVERVTLTGEFDETAQPVTFGERSRAAELFDVLAWAIEAGVPQDDIEFVWACQETVGRRATAELAAARGISVRTLYRRRVRTLGVLRAAVEDRLSLVA